MTKSKRTTNKKGSSISSTKQAATRGSTESKSSKSDVILQLLRRKQGASLDEMQKVSGWQSHSVRGYLSGTVKKRLGLTLNSHKSPNGDRRYVIAG